MKNYIKSFLPYRWIILLIFLVLTQCLIICFNKIGLNDTEFTTILSIASPFFWIAIDILFGLGRVSPLTNKPLIQIPLILLLYGSIFYAMYNNLY